MTQFKLSTAYWGLHFLWEADTRAIIIHVRFNWPEVRQGYNGISF